MASPAASSTTTFQSFPESSANIQQKSELVHKYARELGPAVRNPDALRATFFVVANRLFQINRLALAYLLFGCNVAALQTFLVAKTLIMTSATALGNVASSAWGSKPCRRLRKKLEFEFFVLILGCGNGFFLFFFWPGWLLVALAGLAYLIWSWAG